MSKIMQNCSIKVYYLHPILKFTCLFLRAIIKEIKQASRVGWGRKTSSQNKRNDLRIVKTEKKVHISN